MIPRANMQYTPIKSKDELEDDTSLAPITKDEFESRYHTCSNHYRIYVICALSVCISFAFLLASLSILSPRSRNSYCSSQWHMRTPLEDTVAADPPVTVRFNGRFWEENAFKGPPTPERDAAWSKLTKNGGMLFLH